MSERRTKDKVLVVDDEQMIRYTLTEALHSWGHTVVEGSLTLRERVDLALKVVRCELSSVSLQEEWGRGKGIVAEGVHFRSRRSSARFIAINCAGIPFSLMESGLFCYEKGAFSEAK